MNVYLLKQTKMKANLKIQGVIELTDADLLKALKLIVLNRTKDLFSAVTKVVEEVYHYTPVKVQKDDELNKVTAIIDQTIDEGAVALGREPKPAVDRESNKGFTRRWTGFYAASQEIFEELRRKNKHRLSLSDFYKMLLDYDDVASGGKLFVKKGEDGKKEQIELTRVKQYLSPSQLKKTPQMKGIKWDDKAQEFKF